MAEHIWTKVEKYTEDGKKGMCLCPYFECRKSKDATFMVHFDKKTYMCIGCGVSGRANQIEKDGDKINLLFY